MCLRILFYSAVIFISSVQCQNEPLSEGERCKTKSGRVGSCKLYSQCPAAMEAVKKGHSPELCSFSSEPVVCCPKSAAVVEELSSDVRNSVFFRKCEEYKSVITQRVNVPALIIRTIHTNRMKCSIPVGNQLIINGIKSRRHEFPHLALLGFGPKDGISWLCGGSLISDRYVLTAGHCIFSRGSNVSFVLLGDLDTSTTDDNVQTQLHEVADIRPHPDYSPTAHYHDIALLRLKDRVTFTMSVRPACIHAIPARLADDVVATVTGWGITETGKNSDHLLKADLTFVDISNCTTFYPRALLGRKLSRGLDENTMLCAGDPQGMKDTCQGDSGGPIQIILTEPYCMYGIVGVTSFGPKACGQGQSPGVYTRVSFYRPWIESVVWPKEHQ